MRMTVNPLLVRPADGLLPPGLSPADELQSKRRTNSKTYQAGGSSLNLSAAMGLVHYRDEPADQNELWKEIDLTLDANGQMSAAPYSITVFTDRMGYAYTSKTNGYTEVELIEVGNSPVNNGNFTIRREGNQLFWDNVETGLSLKIILTPSKAEIFKQLASDTVARQLKWRIQEDTDVAAVKIARQIFGADGNGDGLEMVVNVDNQTNGTRGPRNIAYRQFDFEEIWTGRVSRRIDPATRQKAWFDDPVYPVIIDQSTNENIVANVDDGYSNNTASPWLSSTTFAGGNDWVFGFYAPGTINVNGGVRFQTLGVPQGATITSSTLTLNITNILSAGGYNPAVIIFADDVDDAPVWANNSRPQQITQTTASTNLTVTATGDTTANITSIVQEIISRTGWSSGNDIRFGLLENVPPTGGNSAFAYVYDYNQGQTLAARLDVVYTVPGGVPLLSPRNHPSRNLLLRM